MVSKYLPKDIPETKPNYMGSVLAFVFLAIPCNVSADADLKSKTPLLHGALSIAPSIEDFMDRMRVLKKTASGYIELGKKTKAKEILDQLLEMTGKIKNNEHKAQMLKDIAQDYATVKDFSTALKAAEQIDIPYWHTVALADIARQYSAFGQKTQAMQTLAKAIEIARTETLDMNRYFALMRLARTYAKLGEKQMVKTLMQEIPPEYLEKAVNLLPAGLSVIVYGETGEFEQALKALKTIPIDIQKKLALLGSLAAFSTQATQLEELQTILEQHNSYKEENHDVVRRESLITMSKIANQYILLGEPEKTLSILANIDRKAKKLVKKKKNSGYQFTKMLVRIARVHLAVGNTSQTSFYLSRAWNEIFDLEKGMRLSAEIATAYTKLGRISDARALIEEINIFYKKVRGVFERIDRAARQNLENPSQIGKIMNSSIFIKEIEDSLYAVKILGAISQKLIEDGEVAEAAKALTQALKTIKPQETARLRSLKLIQLAKEYTRAGLTPSVSDLVYLDKILQPTQLPH